jgi:hypothetical protein
MLHVLILLDIHLIILYKNDGTLIAIGPAIVRCTENSDNRRKSLSTTPSMHLIAIDLDLMSSNDRKKVILLKYLFDGFEAELHRALPFLVFHEVNLHAG